MGSYFTHRGEVMLHTLFCKISFVVQNQEKNQYLCQQNVTYKEILIWKDPNINLQLSATGNAINNFYGMTQVVKYLQCVETALCTGAEHNAGLVVSVKTYNYSATNNMRKCGAMIPIHQTSCYVLATIEYPQCFILQPITMQ